MTKTLRIEVTPELVNDVVLASGVTILEYEQWEAALTAAFQHPEFVRQIREQALARLDETPLHYIGGVPYIKEDDARASLGRLLGEEHG